MHTVAAIGILVAMREITEHLTRDSAERFAILVSVDRQVVQREAAGQTYWYAVPNELPRSVADADIELMIRRHLMAADADGRGPCRRCARPLHGIGVGDYHTSCVPVDVPSDPSLFEVWPA